MTIFILSFLTFKCDLNLQPTNLRFVFTKNPNLKKEFFFFFFFFFGGGGGGGGGWRGAWGWGRGIWMVRQTGPNQFAPSTSSKLGASECINVQVMSLTSSIYDHFII